MDPRDPALAPKNAPKGHRAAPRSRGVLFFLLLFLALVLAIDALVGDRGVFAVMRARREYAELDAALARLREHNARLEEEARRLRQEEASAIEALARQHLGLVKPGETLFIVKDARASKAAPR